MNEKENGDNKWWAHIFDRLNNLAYQKLFFIWALTLILFGIVFFALSYVPGNGPVPLSGDSAERFLNALYYSVITATNTGYGDVLPHGISRLFAALEAVVGLFVFAVFITKLMSRRQDIALREIHKLTFENTFHNFRESLHVVRKDFDFVMEHARSKQGVSTDDYHRLAVAYEQYANILNELPTFYKAGGGFYTLDRRREDLLREAVSRTLDRIHSLLEELSATDTPWMENDESIPRLRELVRVVHSCVTEWQRRSSHGADEAFEEILTTADRITAQFNAHLVEKPTGVNKKTKTK